MINIQPIPLEKYQDAPTYEHVENGIYKDLSDTAKTNYRIALSFELEDGEDTQYPIEDLLDKYRIHVSDFLESESEELFNVELAGPLENLRLASSIIGKRVYNKDVVEDGKTYVSLVIE